MATDPFSIESIQSRAPALSKSDYEFIDEGMRSGELLPQITDSAKRSSITERLLATEELIPSLWTLLREIRYLKKPAKLLNSLLPPQQKSKKRKGLRERLCFHFFEREPTSSTGYQQATIPCSPESLMDPFDAAYQQLWLCSCRVWIYPTAFGLIHLATLADLLGFSSTQIKRELDKDPGRIIIEKALQEAHNVLHPGETFCFSHNQAKPLIKLFNEHVSNTLVSSPITSNPFLTVASPGEPVSRRSGHSSSDTEDLGHLFLDKIHAPLKDYQRAGDEVSSFYVKRCRHIAFFGALNLNTTTQNGPTAVPLIGAQQQHMSFTLSSYARSSIYSDEVSLNEAQDTALSMGRVVTFIEDDVEYQVSYDMGSVNNQAQTYAERGKKLKLRNGHHMVWYECFQILERAAESTVIVYKVQDPAELDQRMVYT